MNLYKLDNKKALRIWTVISEDDGYEVSHGLLGGEQQIKFTDVDEGKVNRTVDEQIELEVNSLIKKKKDKGYCETIEAAKMGVTNSMGFKLPMLGLPLDKLTRFDPDKEYWIQNKYNGHRCMITRSLGELVAYSKSGQPITSIPRIFDELGWVKEGMLIDGELYHHGTPIQTISSWVRRRQSSSDLLSYIIYDMVMDDVYAVRHATFAARVHAMNCPLPRRVQIAPTRLSKASAIRVAELLVIALRAGYEGLMLRDKDSYYEDGKRSKSLIKVKKWETQEYPVIGFKQGKDGWAICTCRVSETATVDVTAPGTHIEKCRIWRERGDYLGRLLQVQFAEFTSDGVPFHPIAVYWRDPE